MWPSIPSYRSFGSVDCPSGANCQLPYCIFGHQAAENGQTKPPQTSNKALEDQEPDAKRCKLDNKADKPLVPVPLKADANVFVGSILPKDKPAVTKQEPQESPAAHLKPSTDVNALTSSAANLLSKPNLPVPLMPRKLNKEPATFTKRITLLKALHSYMKPLNDKIAKAVKSEIKALHLSPDQLNKLAVDEEEQIAMANPSVYENMVKQRLVRLKTMAPELWVKERREVLAKERGDAPKKEALKRVDTGLTPKEEVVFLSVLNCPQTGLEAHGYVTQLPSEDALEEAQRVYEAAGFWEECDRCSTRFQVFPDRREEDGALTTGGQCRYHWGKRNFAKKNKNAAVPEPTKLTCCNEPVGSPGCTTHDTHVFNVKDSKRLSLMMPFMETPENKHVPPLTAVCFDCEMGYTTHGLEMLRLTAISWPQHKPLIDVLVRPLGHLLDVNTRFSGVTAEQFINAKPYDADNPKPIRSDLRIVDSPYIARNLFLSHVSPNTPVLGHALENDLNTIRLIHPVIIDTILLYPTRQGLPFRYGLRNLAKTHLGEDIQQAGAAGHDSFEDARTTGELIRFKVKEKWKSLKADGWTLGEEGVFPPVPKGRPPLKAPHAPSMVPVATMAVLEGGNAVKRKFEDEQETIIPEQDASM